MKKLLLFLTFAVLLFAFAFSAAAEESEACVSYEGFAARLKGDATAIRSLYSVDMDKVAALEAEGYEVHIGAVMGIANYKGVDVNRVSDLLVSYDHETKKVSLAEGVGNASRVVVYATGDMVYASDLWVSRSGTNWRFAYTATNESENADLFVTDLCFRGFAVIVDSDGNASIAYSDGIGDVFGESASIFEVASYFLTYNDGVYKDNTLLNTAIAYCKNYEWSDVAASVGSGVTLSSGAAVITGKDAEGATRNSVYMPKNAKITVVVDAAMEGIYGIGVRYANTAASGSGKNLNVKNKTVAHSVTNVMRLQSVSGEGISETLTTADGTAYTVPVEDAAYRGCGGSGESLYSAYVYLERGSNELEIWVTGTPITVSSLKLTMLRGAGYDPDGYILLKASEAKGYNINYNTTSKTFHVSNSNKKYVDFSFTVKESGVYSMGAMMGWILNNEARVIQFYDATDDTKTGADFAADQSGSRLLYTYSKSECSDYRHSNLPSSSDAGALNYRNFGEAYFSKGEHTLRVYTNGQIITVGYVSLILKEADTEPKTDIEVEGRDLAPKNGGSYALDEKTAYIGVGSVYSYSSMPYIATTVNADIEGMYAIYGKYVFANNAGTVGVNCDLFVKNNSTDEGRSGAFYGYSLKTNAAAPTDYSVPRAVKKGDYSDAVMCYVYLQKGPNDLMIFNHTGGKIGIYALRFSLVTEGGLPNSVFVAARSGEKNTTASNEGFGANKNLDLRSDGIGKSYADYSVTVNESGYYHLYASLGYNNTSKTNSVKFSDIVKNEDGSVSVLESLPYTLASSFYIPNYRGTGEADVGYMYLEKGTHTIRYELTSAGHVVSMLNFRLYREDPISDSGTQIDRNGNLVVRGKLNANALVTLRVTDIQSGEILHLATTRSDRNGEYRFETHQNLDFVYYTIATEYRDALTKAYATRLLTTSVVAERVRDNTGGGGDELSVVYRVTNYTNSPYTVSSLVFTVTDPEGNSEAYTEAVTDGTVSAGETKDFVFALDPAILPESTSGYVFGAYAVDGDGEKIVSTEGDTMIYMEDFMETIKISYNPNAPEREARGDYSIASLGDLHYGRVEFNLCSTMYERAQAMIDMLLSEYAKGSYDVVFFNGDMVYNEHSKTGGIVGTIAAAHYSEDKGKTVFWNYERLQDRYASYFNGQYTAVDSDVTFVTKEEWEEGVSYDTERVFIVDGDVDITDKAICGGFCALEKKATYKDLMQELYDRYLIQLSNAGIPWFMANGNHDSYTDDDFEKLFGHPKTYAVSVVGADGTADTLQCVIDPHHVSGIDCLSDEGGFEVHSALSLKALEYFQKIMKGVDTYIVGHYYTDEPNTQELVKSSDVIGFVFGHTHVPNSMTYQNKPGVISTTFFTADVLRYYNAKNIVSSAVYNALPEAEKANYVKDLKHTPWGIRFLERITDAETGEGRIESYVTFMERVYDGSKGHCRWGEDYYMEQEYYSTKGVTDSVYTVIFAEIPATEE